MLVASRLTKLSCFAAWFISPTFGGFLFGFLLWGVAAALDSGTFQAFVYDHIQHDQQQKLFGRVYGTASSWTFAGFFLSALAGAVLVQWGFNILLAVTIISLGVSIAFLFAIPPLRPAHSPMQFNQTKDVFLTAVRYIWTSKLLLAFMIIGIAGGGIKGALEEYYPLFLESKGIALVMIGVVIASFEAVKSLGAALAARMHATRERQVLLLGIVGTFMILAATSSSYYVIVFLLLLTFGDALLWIANDAAIQHAARHDNRATLASIKNFGVEAIALLAFALFTIITRHVPLNGLYTAGGVALLLTSLSLLILFAKGKVVGKQIV